MKLSQRLGAAAAACLMSVGLGLAATVPAEAATKGGVTKVKNLTCTQLGYTSPKVKAVYKGGPQIQVFYSRAKNKNCVMLVNTRKDGIKRHMGIAAQFRDSNAGRKSDVGYFSTFAGSLILDNRGRTGKQRCIDTTGWVTVGPKRTVSTNFGGFCG